MLARTDGTFEKLVAFFSWCLKQEKYDWNSYNFPVVMVCSTKPETLSVTSSTNVLNILYIRLAVSTVYTRNSRAHVNCSKYMNFKESVRSDLP